jgi:hypothetical protein
MIDSRQCNKDKKNNPKIQDLDRKMHIYNPSIWEAEAGRS